MTSRKPARRAVRHAARVPALAGVIATALVLGCAGSAPRLVAGQGEDRLTAASEHRAAGEACLREGRSDEAIVHLSQAVEIQEDRLGEEDPEVGLSLVKLAEAHERGGNHHEAKSILRRAISILKAGATLAAPELAGLLYHQAGLHHDVGEHSEAAALYQESLGLAESSLGAGHPRVLDTVVQLAEATRAQGRHAEAAPLLRRAIDGYAVSLGAGHPRVAGLRDALADSYDALGNRMDAARLRTELAEGYGSQARSGLALMAGQLQQLGANLLAQERPDEALAPLQEAKSALIYLHGSEDSRLVPVLGAIAEACDMRGDVTGAERSLVEAVALRERTLGGQHPETRSALEQLARWYDKAGRPEDAAQVRARMGAAAGGPGESDADSMR